MEAAISPLTDLGASVEDALVELCQQGNTDAWRTLHRRYYPTVAAFLRRLGVREHDLEDALQEVFLQTFRSLSQFRGDAQLKTWLYRLCITQARRIRRRARVTEALRRALSLLPPESLTSKPGLCEESARRRVEAALAKLSDTERVVLVLYEMEGVPGKEISQILDCPEATVWRRLHYARRAFRTALGVGD